MAQVELLLDGVNWTGVAVQSLELDQAAWTQEYRYAPDTVRINLQYRRASSAVTALLAATWRTPVRVTSDAGARLFTGDLLPGRTTSVSDEPGTLALEGVDRCQRLDVPCPTISRRGSQLGTLTATLLAAAGMTASEYSLPSPMATIDVPYLTRSAGDESVLDLLDELLWQYGWTLYATADGVVSARTWWVSSTPADRYDVDNIVGDLEVERTEIEHRTVDVELDLVADTTDVLLYRDSPQYDRGTGDVEGRIMLAGTYFPARGAVENVWQNYRTNWIETRRGDDKENIDLISARNQRLVFEADSDLDVVTEEHEALRSRIVVHNTGTDDTRRLRILDVRGDATFRYGTSVVEVSTTPAVEGTLDTATAIPTRVRFPEDLTSDQDSAYIGWTVEIAGEVREITGYEGTLRRATVGVAFSSQPGIGDGFVLRPPARGEPRKERADHLYTVAAVQDFAVGLRDAIVHGSWRFRFSVTSSVSVGATVRLVYAPLGIDRTCAVARRREFPDDPDRPTISLELTGVGDHHRAAARAIRSDVWESPHISVDQRITAAATPEEIVDGTPRGGGTLVPDEPVATATATGRLVVVRWNRQPLLTSLAHHDVQVSASETGPWYEPANHGAAWHEADVDGAAQAPEHEYVHTAIPLGGTIDSPEAQTLWYRVRRVTRAGTEGSWCTPVSATARAVSAGDLAERIVSVAKIDPQRFLRSIDGGLIAQWSLDDSAGGTSLEDLGVIADQSGQGEVLVVSGAAGTWPVAVDGVSGRAVALADGQATGYLSREGFAGLDAATAVSVSLWCKANTAPGTLIDYAASTGQPAVWSVDLRLDLRDADEKLALQAVGKEQLLTPADYDPGLGDGNWHHVVATWDATDGGTIWVDGVQVASGAADTSVRSAMVGSGRMVVGQRTESDGTFDAEHVFDGSIDEVRLYDRVLSQGEIALLYVLPSGPAPGMILGDRVVSRTLLARHITTDTLNTLVAEIQDYLHIGDGAGGDPSGWIAGQYEAPVSGNQRGYLDRDEVALQRHDGTAWQDIIRLLAVGAAGELKIVDRVNSRTFEILTGFGFRASDSTFRAYMDRDEIRLQRYVNGFWREVISLRYIASNSRGGEIFLQSADALRRTLVSGKRGVLFYERSSTGDSYGSPKAYVTQAQGYLRFGGQGLIPSQHNADDLGTSATKWRHLYLSGDVHADDVHADEIVSAAPLKLNRGIRPQGVRHTSSSSSSNNLYDWLSPALPNNSDRVLVSGSGNRRARRLFVFSYAHRIDSNTIKLHGTYMDVSHGSFFLDSFYAGNTTIRTESVSCNDGIGTTLLRRMSGAW